MHSKYEAFSSECTDPWFFATQEEVIWSKSMAIAWHFISGRTFTSCRWIKWCSCMRPCSLGHDCPRVFSQWTRGGFGSAWEGSQQSSVPQQVRNGKDRGYCYCAYSLGLLLRLHDKTEMQQFSLFCFFLDCGHIWLYIASTCTYWCAQVKLLLSLIHIWRCRRS